MANTYSEDAEKRLARFRNAQTEEELNEILREMHIEFAQQEREKEGESIKDILPEEPGYSFKAYDETTDEELQRRAESAYLPLAEGEKQQLKAKSDAQNTKLETEKKEAESDLEQKKSDIGAELESEKKNIENGMLEQGISRSSIRALSERKAEDGAAAASALAESEYASKAAGIDDEIAALGEELNAALAASDAQYAAKVAEELADLIASRDSFNNKVTEYNNKVKQQTEDYKENRQELIKQEIHDAIEAQHEREAYEKQYGYSGDKKENYAERLSLALDFYTQFDPDTALEMIRNNSYLRNYLGYNYNDLVSEFYNRQNRG